MTSSDPIIRRFNGYHSSSSAPLSAGWKLRTQKLIAGEWVTVGKWPPIRGADENERRDLERLQREGIARHAEAFGGLVRLMRAELLLASWRDGRLECDLRGDEVGRAAE